MNDLAGNRTFRFAVALSIVFHLISVASVEAAVLINRALKSNPEPLFFFNLDLGKDSDPSNSIKLQTSPEKPKPLPVAPLPKDKIEIKDPIAELNQMFSESQIKIDRKVGKIQHQLDSIAKPSAKSKPKDVSISYVSDLEKVPLDKVELLPAYLKRMRKKVSNLWLKKVEAGEMGSGSFVAQYRIQSNGSISDLKSLILEGDDSFRKLCLDALSEAAPFGALPFEFSKSLKEKYLTIELAFYLERSKIENIS